MADKPDIPKEEPPAIVDQYTNDLDEQNQIDSNKEKEVPIIQSKYIWKQTKYDGILPITRFVKGVEAKDPNKINLKEQKVDKAAEANKITKITTFVNHKPREQIIKHKLIMDDLNKNKKNEEPPPVEESKELSVKKDESETKKENNQNENKDADKKEEEKKHQGESDKELSDNGQGHEEGEHEQKEQIEEDNELKKEETKSTACVVGEYIFLIDQKQYAFVKSQDAEEDTLYTCKVLNSKNPSVQEEQMLQMMPMDVPAPEGFAAWTNSVNINVRSILTEEKKQTVLLKVNTNDKAMVVAEQIADLFGETKYSISFFFKKNKINLNDRIADIGLGGLDLKNEDTTQTMEESSSTILCLKGGVDAPKIFMRFKQVDSPERQLSYIAEEEAYDAISFIPKKDIKFAGFSIYQVNTFEQDFSCMYKIKIGTEQQPEKVAVFTHGAIDAGTKMGDIMLPQEIIVQKGKSITIGVRFISGDDFFCSTLLGYGGEDYQNPRLNEELAFDVVDTEECTKGETDVTFGQIPRIHYFDYKH